MEQFADTEAHPIITIHNGHVRGHRWSTRYWSHWGKITNYTTPYTTPRSNPPEPEGWYTCNSCSGPIVALSTVCASRRVQQPFRYYAMKKIHDRQLSGSSVLVTGCPVASSSSTMRCHHTSVVRALVRAYLLSPPWLGRSGKC